MNTTITHSFSLSNLTFTSCICDSDGGALDLSVSSSASLTLSDVAFISCTGRMNGGAVKIEVESTGGVFITDCSFTECNASNNDGGGLWMDIKQAESFTLHSCIFNGCSAVDGCGGSFFVEMHTLPPPFEISDIEVMSRGNAVKGEVMYLSFLKEGLYEPYLDVWRHLAQLIFSGASIPQNAIVIRYSDSIEHDLKGSCITLYLSSPSSSSPSSSSSYSSSLSDDPTCGADPTTACTSLSSALHSDHFISDGTTTHSLSLSLYGMLVTPLPRLNNHSF